MKPEPWRIAMDPHAYDGEAENRAIQQMSNWSRFKYFGSQFGVLIGVILYGIFKPFGGSGIFYAIGMLSSALLAGIMSLIFLTLLQHLWESIFK